MDAHEYNPLDYANLTKSCVEELMRRGPFELPLTERFAGAGVYALFYRGDFSPYSGVRSDDATLPIYVGKAVPPGARKGAKTRRPHSSLLDRIAQHVKSINATSSLRVEDFTCRFLVVTPLWITMAERFLLEHYRPIWNVVLDGFGNHHPGSGRYEGEITWWDTLHPGRRWAAKLQQNRTAADAEKRLHDYFEGKIAADLTPPDDESAAAEATVHSRK